MTSAEIAKKIELSSLGTSAARSARSTIPADRAERVVLAAEALARSTSRSLGATSPAQTYSTDRRKS